MVSMLTVYEKLFLQYVSPNNLLYTPDSDMHLNLFRFFAVGRG